MPDAMHTEEQGNAAESICAPPEPSARAVTISADAPRGPSAVSEEHKSEAARWKLRTAMAIAGAFLLFLFLGLTRHWSYLTSLNDLGVFDQAVSETLHGHWFRVTAVFGTPINWLGFHFNPVLLAFVPLYAITPSVLWFTVAQALALALSAWPIFTIAGQITGSQRTAFLWALAFLLDPFLINAAAWDFHPVTLAVPLLAGALLAIERGQLRLFTVLCIVLLTVQEQFGLTVAGLGLLWGAHRRQPRTALVFALGGVVYTVLVLGWIIPALSPSGEHVMFSAQGGQLSRYAWLGASPLDAVRNMLFHPWLVMKQVFIEQSGLHYLRLLLLPFIGLPAAAPVWLLPGAGDLSANLLSFNMLPRSVYAYHTATLLPMLTVAAIYGAKRLSARFGAHRFTEREAAGLALFAAVIACWRFMPLPLPGASNFWKPELALRTDPMVEQVREIIGTGSVSAQANIGAHFSRRSDIYMFPAKARSADAVVLRLRSPTHEMSVPDCEVLPSLGCQLQIAPADYLGAVDCLLSSHRYRVRLWKDPWLVLVPGTGEPPPPDLFAALHDRARQWNVTPTPVDCRAYN